jgi:hypothetical protein
VHRFYPKTVILHKELELLRILVSVGVLELITEVGVREGISDPLTILLLSQ